MPSRPNILFIHVGQMHFQSLSSYGNRYVKTPAMATGLAEGIWPVRNYVQYPANVSNLQGIE